MKTLVPILLSLGIAACDGNNGEPTTYTYQLKITNLTNGQPFSPVAAILHDEGYSAWTIGDAASVELEQLAEGGAVAPLLNSRKDDPSVAGSAPVGPGQSDEFLLSTTDNSRLNVTIATMLVNTNDAFTGLTDVDLSAMQKGDTRIYLTNAYDAGTEQNSEVAATFPGPAGGGEGFNADRDDVVGVVTGHGGIVSHSDGYPASALSEAHRFDNPVMKIEITRM